MEKRGCTRSLTNNSRRATTPIPRFPDIPVTGHRCGPQASGAGPGHRRQTESHSPLVTGIDSRETSSPPFSSLVLSDSRSVFDLRNYYIFDSQRSLKEQFRSTTMFVRFAGTCAATRGQRRDVQLDPSGRCRHEYLPQRRVPQLCPLVSVLTRQILRPITIRSRDVQP